VNKSKRGFHIARSGKLKYGDGLLFYYYYYYYYYYYLLQLGFHPVAVVLTLVHTGDIRPYVKEIETEVS
jgi:hypothetical protein